MTKAVLNQNQPDEMVIEGFVFSLFKCIFTCIIVFLTGGLYVVLLSWRADIRLNSMYRQVPLHEAQVVLLKDKFGQIFAEQVHKRDAYSENMHFHNKKIKYVWNSHDSSFEKHPHIDENMKQSQFHKCKEGLGQLTVADRLQEYGENLIRISVPSVVYLVFHEALNPFYLFQAYTVILWTIQFYWKFAAIIAVTSVISVTLSVWETRRQSRNLRDKMKSESIVTVFRNGTALEISSVELVPGDVILLSTSGGFMMECDAVLIEGTCVVNESMLTGESIPITKAPLPDDDAASFNYDHQRQYVVFCGTEVLQGKNSTGNHCKAVVIRTGFMTTKGELVRSILFPPPLDFKFHRDFIRSIGVFLSMGLVGMTYSLYMWHRNGGSLQEMLLNSLDILTFVVPPILPAALTANNAFAQKRLEKEGIYCLHSKHISLCGGIDICAFDKTGTLTEGNLDLKGVVESRGTGLNEMVADPTQLPLDSPIIQAMATCHSLIKLKGSLTGNPLDVKLFEGIEWELTEQPGAGVNPDYGIPTPTLVAPPKGIRNGGHVKMAPSNLEIAVLKSYPFDSSVQRLTVVTKKKGSPQFDVYVKGAPEKIASLCKPETIPPDFSSTLMRYTTQGLRVIAAATKSLSPKIQWKEADDMSRADLEEKAEFLGLIVMQNSVKEQTFGAIKALHDADIVTVMVTGDNILTALSVGRECELVKPDQTVIRVQAELQTDQYTPHLNVSYTLEDNEKTNIVHDSNFIKSVQEKNYVFACDGKTFGLIRNNDRALLDRIVQRGKIFARMLPEQKIHLIECMKDLGRQTIMCGDGCNDCGALKAAHAGISLSLAEASVAAPFTSKNVHIGCVPYLIREGRATMVSSFASFKFGVGFCFTQLIAVLMVFYIGTEPSDNQYLVVDIGLGALPSLMIGNCGPHDILVKRKPPRHLLSFIQIFSIISFLFFQTCCYVVMWYYLKMQPWYEEYVFEKDLFPPKPSYEQTNIFVLSCAACIVASIVFSKGAPYRKHLFTNGIMAVWLIAGIATTIFIALFDTQDFKERLNMMQPPNLIYKLTLIGGMVINLIWCYFWEVFVLDELLFSRLLPLYKERVRGPALPFEYLEEELKSKRGWPPIGDCKNNEIKIDIKTSTGGKEAEEKAMKSGNSGNTLYQQDQQSSSNVALRDHLRLASRDVKRSIQNRWSGNGIGAVTGEGQRESSSFSADEHQGLLSGACEPPYDSPLAQPKTHKQQPSMVSVATSTDNPNINNVMDDFPTNQSTSIYYNPNQISHQQNYENNMISNYSSSTASNDLAPPPYSTSFPINSQKQPSIAQPSSSGAAHMYTGSTPYSQAQHHMDTPSTSQLQRTINRTLLGGNESTLLSDQQPQPGYFTSPARETTIC